MQPSSVLDAVSSALKGFPTLGCLPEPSPVQSLPVLSREVGVGSLWVKQDHRIGAFGGGCKTRKLDFLLASPPFADADCWQSFGAIGSGQLVALAQAAREYDRRVIAHCFAVPPTKHSIENVALIASGPVEVRFYRSRPELIGRHPFCALGHGSKKAPTIPFGATSVVGMLGFVRAAIELAEQISAGELPSPDTIYIPFGSGGCVAGLSVGLGFIGSRVQIVAVSAVERWLLNRRRLRSLQTELLRYLRRRCGLGPAAPVPVHLDYSALGAGYGHASPASCAALERLAGFGVPLEPVYTGKAAAALLARARSRYAASDVLFWNTVRGPLGPPADDWRSRLPADLRTLLPHFS